MPRGAQRGSPELDVPVRPMKEITIEQYLVEQVEARGGKCEKFTSPGRRSVPDRLVTWMGTMDLVETKRPGGKPRAYQVRDHQDRLELGVLVRVLDTKAAVDAYILSRYHVWPKRP